MKNTFKATIKVEGPKTIGVYLKLSGTSPFKKGAKRFIAKAQVALAFLKGQDVPKPVIESPVLGLNAVVNNLLPASNKKEQYYSVNLVPGGEVEEMVITREVLLFTAYFENGIPQGLKIRNAVSAFLNPQCQLAIEDNHGVEYTDPFSNPSALFYSTPSQSRIGHAGAGEGGNYAGMTTDGSTPVTATYESWVKLV